MDVNDDDVLEDEATAAVDALVAEAESLGAEERWDQAQTLLLEALPDHPRDALLLCWLGIASERLGEEGEAYDFFRRCLAEEPSDPFILAAAGSGVAMYDDPEAEGEFGTCGVAVSSLGPHPPSHAAPAAPKPRKDRRFT